MLFLHTYITYSPHSIGSYNVTPLYNAKDKNKYARAVLIPWISEALKHKRKAHVLYVEVV